MLAALTVFVDNFESLSRFAAGISRLQKFTDFLRTSPDERPRTGPRISVVEAPYLAFSHLTVMTPDYERTLVRGLSLDVRPGEGLLIVGESGCGKSSLLRTIAGLWDSGSGTISRPRSEQMLFLPQHAYMTIGSLRRQLLYPCAARALPDDDLRAVLERVNLPDLAERYGGFDVELDFGKMLSLGEQQRLALARVLIARPRYAILDEATSALDAENEERIYRELLQMGTTLVSVSHRAAAVRHHENVLELRADGRFRPYKASKYSIEV
jgi:putative ATP-binding cassette transporter